MKTIEVVEAVIVTAWLVVPLLLAAWDEIGRKEA